MNVGDDPRGHEGHRQDEDQDGLGGLLGRGQDFVEFLGEIQGDQVVTALLELAERLPGSGQEQGVAAPQDLLADTEGWMRVAAPAQADHRQLGVGQVHGLGHRHIDELRLLRDHDLDHADVIGLVDEVALGARQYLDPVAGGESFGIGPVAVNIQQEDVIHLQKGLRRACQYPPGGAGAALDEEHPDPNFLGQIDLAQRLPHQGGPRQDPHPIFPIRQVVAVDPIHHPRLGRPPASDGVERSQRRATSM